MQQQGVCILKTRDGVGDADAIQQAGYKIRYASTIVPDLLFSKKGVSVAVVLIDGAVAFPAERIEKVKNGFRHAFVLSSSKITPLQVGSCTRNGNYPQIICGLGEGSLTKHALDLMEDYFMIREAPESIQDSDRMSGEIHSNIMHAIPSLVLETHQAAALRMIGSIAQLARCTEEEIMAVTDLNQSQCQQLLEFFNKPLNAKNIAARG